ncbi:MAG: FkbM family methyltransferase [Bryobacteraceae bacterium]|jgi:FkbM family methyltransferase
MAFGYIAKLFRRYGPVLTTGSVFTLWREARYRKAHGSAPQRVVRVRLARRPFSHVSLRADSDDPHTVVEIFHDAVYQPALDALGECRSIIDLGANIGLSCLYFADRCPGAKIFALEPFPSNYKLLQINTAALLRAGVCRTLQAAFWRDEDTNLTFRLPEENSSAAVFLAPASETPAGERVRGLTMNSILAESGFDRVDLLKVDIEGAEADLFRGRNEWLHRVRGIAVEFHGDARRESGFDDTMREFGFRIADEWQHTVLAIRTSAPVPA